MRKQPKAPPDVKLQPQDDIVTQEREYTLITPLFGGGAVAGERDAVTIVRGTEVRGMLRFWWRACYGGRYENVEDMKKAEDRIWGAAATAKSKQEEEKIEDRDEEKMKSHDTNVYITIDLINEGIPIEPFPILTPEEYRKKKGKETRNRWEALYEPLSEVPEYAAFMLQLPSEEKSKRDRPDSKLVYKNVEFKLTISYPKEMQTDIEGALWAWETFGGIGARTRRGFGALQLTKIGGEDNTDYPSNRNPVEWIRERIVDLQTKSEPQVKGKAPENVPCLWPDMMMQFIKADNATKAWEGVITKLSDYRQVPNGRANQFSASKWPEADTIRRLVDPLLQSTMPQKFPRAAFGLPIIFNFMKRPDLQKRPLQGASENHERLASPLILRPLRCKKDENKKDVVIGLAIVLENFSFPPEGIVFIEKNKPPHPVEPHIEEDEVDRIKPLREADVLHDFMNYFEGK